MAITTASVGDMVLARFGAMNILTLFVVTGVQLPNIRIRPIDAPAPDPSGFWPQIVDINTVLAVYSASQTA